MAKRKKTKPQKSLAQSAHALRANGLKAFQQGDYPQAIATWERIPPALRPLPALAEAYFRQGLQHQNAPRPDIQLVLNDLQQAAALLPDDPCYTYHAGLAAHRAGNLAQAISSYRKARRNETRLAARTAYPLALALLQSGQDPADDPVWETLTNHERGMLTHARAFRRRPYTLPSSAPTLWHALAALDAGDTATAEAGLHAATDAPASSAEHGLAHYYRGTLAARQGDLETARQEWTAAYAGGLRTPKLEHNLGELFHRMAEDLLHRDDPVTALEAVQEATRHSPKNRALDELHAHLHQQLGYQAASAGRWDQAQTHWQTAVSLDSGSFRLAYNLALAYERAGDYGEAANTWREVLRRRPRRADHPDAITDEQVARLWQRAAEAYLRAGEYDEATKVYQQAVKWAPENVTLRLSLAENLIRSGRLRAAENELQRILDRDPDHIPALMQMGEVLFRSEQWWVQMGAPRYWEKVLILQPGHLPARQALGDFYRDQAEIDFSWENYTAAIEDYEKALAYQPDDAWTLAAIANCKINLKDEPNAQPFIERALALAPADLDVLHEILDAWLNTQQWEKAWQLMKVAETRIPEIPAQYYISKAIACIEAGHNTQAEPWLIQAQARAKPGEHILLMIGELLMDSAPALARQYLEQALAAGQYPGQAHLDLGMLDDWQGKTRESTKHFREAERLARKTNDRELAERIEIARVLADGPQAFINRLINLGDPELVDDFFSNLLEDEFDD